MALPSYSDGPVAGTATAGTQPHFVTLNRTGTRAFISNGGDGSIVVVDTGKRRITKTISTPTPLTGGGYLTTIKRGSPVTDLVAR